MTIETSSLQSEPRAIEQSLQEAVARHQAGELRDAEKNYRAILQLMPDHPKVNHNLGMLLMQMGRPAAGLPFFSAALDVDPAHGQYWLSYIDALSLSGQREEAIQVLAFARENGLEGEEVDALAARMERGRKGEAGHQHGDEQAQEEINVLIALFNQGRHEEAENLARMMTARFPGCWAGWKMLGVLCNLKGMSAEALYPMQQAVLLSPTDAESHNNLGIVLQKLNRLDEAEASYRRALQINPDYVHAQSNLGATLQELGRQEEAMASYRCALRLDPNYARAHNNLGSLLQDMGLLEEAVATYLRALEIDPGYVEALYNLGVALNLLNRQKEAEAAFRSLLQVDPVHAEAYYFLGNILLDAGRLDEAEECQRQALKVDPGYAEANNNLGVILKRKEREEYLSEAEECCRKAIRGKPDFVEAYSNLGTILQALGRLDEAEASYRHALQIKPDFASALVNLGTTLQGLGRLQDAEASCRSALRIRPDHAAAHMNLGYILCDLDELGKAAAEFQRALELDPEDIGLDAAVYLAVLDYLDGNFDHCRYLLDSSRSVMEQIGTKHKHVRGYWLYLDLLLSCSQEFRHETQVPPVKTLYVVGESHTLSAHGLEVPFKGQQVKCTAEWVLGCKQWHLGNGTNNKYKQKFYKIMARLPRESTILLMIGEIDCRYDEGIIKAWEKHPGRELSQIADATVTAYIDHVATVGRRYGHRMIVGGVPAPNISLEKLMPATAEQLVFLIRKVNAALAQRSLMAGMGFLDVYALTDRGDGIANERWHIDQYHLRPGALVEAFEKHCRP